MSVFQWRGCKLIFAFGFNVDAILAAGFNTAGCYTAPSDALLDECLRKGLWLIPDLHIYFYDDDHIDLSGAIAFVNRWKHHPAVAAWYFLDEPDLKSSKFNESAQQGWYNALKAADPNHDLLTAFTAHIEKHWNPNAFDHVCFDAYPYHKDTPDWEPRLRNSCNVCRSRSGGIGGMAVVQASYNGGSLNPTGIVDDMLRVFQENGIGTQRDGYAMYAWGGHGTPPEDSALLTHVIGVNRNYNWSHASPSGISAPPPEPTPEPAPERRYQAEAPKKVWKEYTCPEGDIVEISNYDYVGCYEPVVGQIICPSFPEPKMQYCPTDGSPVATGYDIRLISAIERKLEPIETEKPAEERLLLAPAPPQEAERRKKEILEQLPIFLPPGPVAPLPTPAPKVTLAEAIISPEWWRENWSWIGVGAIGLTTIAILAKRGK